MYLTEEQEAATDNFEKLGIYYDKLTVPVQIHKPGNEIELATANVYRMTQERID